MTDQDATQEQIPDKRDKQLAARTTDQNATQEQIPDKRDKWLSEHAYSLLPTGLSLLWTTTTRPHTDLHTECQQLIDDTIFIASLHNYLAQHTELHNINYLYFTCRGISITKLLSESKSENNKIWWIWNINSLIISSTYISGPFGAFLYNKSSPLFSKLGSAYPLLSTACEYFNKPDIRMLCQCIAQMLFYPEQNTIHVYDLRRKLFTAILDQYQIRALDSFIYSIANAIHFILTSAEEIFHVQ